MLKNKLRVGLIIFSALLVITGVFIYNSANKITDEKVSESVEQYQMMLNGDKEYKGYVEESHKDNLDQMIEDNNYNEVEGLFIDTYLKDIDLEYVSHVEKDGKIEIIIKVNSVDVNGWRGEFNSSMEDYLSDETISIVTSTKNVDEETRLEHIGNYWVEYSNYLKGHTYTTKEVKVTLDKNYKMSENQFNTLINELFNN